MFERFTEPARRVVVLGQQEARTLGHPHLGAEHLLLGLLREEEGVAARALAGLGVTADAARTRVMQVVGTRGAPTTGDIPFTPPARRALEAGLREATLRRDRHVGTEHLLLGLTREPDTVAASVLVDLTGGLDAVRNAVGAQIDAGGALPTSAPRAADPGELGRALQRAAALSDGKRPVDGADLLVGLAEAGGAGAAVLAELGVDREGLRRAVEAARRR